MSSTPSGGRSRSVVRRSLSVRREQVVMSFDRRRLRALVFASAIAMVGVFTFGFYLGFWARSSESIHRLLPVASRPTPTSSAPSSASSPASPSSSASPSPSTSPSPAAPLALADPLASSRTSERPSSDSPSTVATSTTTPSPGSEAPTATGESRPIELSPPKPDDVAGSAFGPDREARRAGAADGTSGDRAPPVVVRARPPPGSFGLQFGSFETLDEARAFVLSSSWDRDLDVYVQPTPVPGKGTWYRVRAGGFSDLRAAERKLAGLSLELASRAIIVRYR